MLLLNYSFPINSSATQPASPQARPVAQDARPPSIPAPGPDSERAPRAQVIGGLDHYIDVRLPGGHFRID